MGHTAGALLVLCVTLVPAIEAFTHGACSDIHEYNVLHDLMNTDSCMSVDSVFKYLHDVTEKWHSGHCRIDIIQKLSDHFGGSQAHTPDHCQCTGTNRLEQYTHLQGVFDEVNTCTRIDHYYVEVYNQFFINNNHLNAPACRTHHSLWNQLKLVTQNNFGCQKDLVYHLNYAFSVHSEPCTCGEKPIAPTPTPDAGQSQHQGNNDGNPCHQYASYHELAKLLHERGCMSANSVWHLLDDLQVKNANCRKEIQDRLTKAYSSVSADGNDNCNCYSRDHLVNKPHVHFMNNGSHHECQSEPHTTYDNLERDLFTHITDRGCRNHNYLWPTLAGVLDTNLNCNQRPCYHTHTVKDCTADFIVRAAIDYPSSASDSCVCESIATTPSPTTSTAAPIPTTPAPTTTTTQLFSTKYTCNKFQAIEDIAKSIHVTHPDSTACDPNSGGSDDAYTIVACNMTSPTMWHKGINVMQDCRSSTHAIPTYIPIATFSSGSDLFVPNGAQSGIFLGCQGNGFKMAVQKCNDVPKLIIVENGTFVNNPDNYYVVV